MVFYRGDADVLLQWGALPTRGSVGFRIINPSVLKILDNNHFGHLILLSRSQILENKVKLLFYGSLLFEILLIGYESGTAQASDGAQAWSERTAREHNVPTRKSCFQEHWDRTVGAESRTRPCRWGRLGGAVAKCPWTGWGRGHTARLPPLLQSERCSEFTTSAEFVHTTGGGTPPLILALNASVTTVLPKSKSGP